MPQRRRVKAAAGKGQSAQFACWMETLSMMPSADLMRFDAEIRDLLSDCAMAPGDAADMGACVEKLRDAIQRLGPGWTVQPFGSFTSGFGIRGCDLDATCYREGLDEQDNTLAIEELKLQLVPLLAKHPRFDILQEVWSARIPIVKLRFDRSLEVDLSCHNFQAVQNTRLLKAYADLDPQVRDLVVAVKAWAKAESVCGAPVGHLSSYALTLMALYFMQVDPEISLPCLEPSVFAQGKGRVPDWCCPLPISVLLCRFFQFYASTIWWGVEVVSVRLGRRCGTSDPTFLKLPGRLASSLHIEDPFLLGRNLTTTLGEGQETMFYGRIAHAAAQLQQGSTPLGLARGSGQKQLCRKSDVGASEPSHPDVVVSHPITPCSKRCTSDVESTVSGGSAQAFRESPAGTSPSRFLDSPSGESDSDGAISGRVPPQHCVSALTALS